MEKSRKAIILAGGTGSRLFPLTNSISKQILPIYNKPMIYYALTVLMLANIKEYLLITTPRDIDIFKNLLGNGEQFGISIYYKIQNEPKGIAEAFILGENFLEESPSALILGDNFFYGQSLTENLKKNSKFKTGAKIYLHQVKDPSLYGVALIKNKSVVKIVEKPKKTKSNLAITGLYLFNHEVINFSQKLRPSKRNELEITDINNYYLKESNLKYFKIKPKKKLNLNKWKKVTKTITSKNLKEVNIAIIGKYVELKDAYKSLDEALTHGGLDNNLKVNLIRIESDKLKAKEIKDKLEIIGGHTFRYMSNDVLNKKTVPVSEDWENFLLKINKSFKLF